jgi:flagellar protein FlaG
MNIPSVSASLPVQSSPSSSEAGVVSQESKAVASAQEITPSEQSAQSSQPVTEKQLKTAINSVQEYIKPYNSSLEFSINDDINQVVVKVVDSSTKEVIRQIPSEEMIAIAKALDSIKGLFVKQQA